MSSADRNSLARPIVRCGMSRICKRKPFICSSSPKNRCSFLQLSIDTWHFIPSRHIYFSMKLRDAVSLSVCRSISNATPCLASNSGLEICCVVEVFFDANHVHVSPSIYCSFSALLCLGFLQSHPSDCQRLSFGSGFPLDRCSWTILISPSVNSRMHVMTQ